MNVKLTWVLSGIVGAAVGFAASAGTADAVMESRYISPQGGQGFGKADCITRDWWTLGVTESCSWEYVAWPLSRVSTHDYLGVNVKFRQKDKDFSCSLYSVPANGQLGYVVSNTAKKTGTSRNTALNLGTVSTPSGYTVSTICSVYAEHYVYGLFQYTDDN